MCLVRVTSGDAATGRQNAGKRPFWDGEPGQHFPVTPDFVRYQKLLNARGSEPVKPTLFLNQPVLSNHILARLSERAQRTVVILQIDFGCTRS